VHIVIKIHLGKDDLIEASSLAASRANDQGTILGNIWAYMKSVWKNCGRLINSLLQ
jgi:hypothetical protein